MGRRIVHIARLERDASTLRFKQRGTLERHDVELPSIEKVFVRLTPHPDKQIIADILTADAVYRCTEGQTLINYPTFLDEVAPGGLENFRGYVAWLLEQIDASDPATEEFAQGKPPEAFASAEELMAYDAYLEGRESVLPRGSGEQPTSAPAPTSAEIERVWAEHASELRKEAASGSGPDPRLAGYVLVGLGALIGFAGVFLLMALVTNERLTEYPASTGIMGLLGLCALIGVIMMLAGVLVVRKAQQLSGET